MHIPVQLGTVQHCRLHLVLPISSQGPTDAGRGMSLSRARGGAPHCLFRRRALGAGQLGHHDVFCGPEHKPGRAAQVVDCQTFFGATGHQLGDVRVMIGEYPSTAPRRSVITTPLRRRTSSPRLSRRGPGGLANPAHLFPPWPAWRCAPVSFRHRAGRRGRC